MGFRLSEPQSQLIGLVERQFAQKATPQLRFFWKKLRSVALPPMPKRKKRQGANEYALDQIRWQRTAALAVESHVAAAQLLRNEIELIQVLESKTIEREMTPAEAAAALVQQVMDAPLKVKWEVYRRILEAHPNFEEQE